MKRRVKSVRGEGHDVERVEFGVRSVVAGGDDAH